jgi:hypothetical protein
MDETLDPSYDPWTDTTNNLGDNSSSPSSSTSSLFSGALAALPQLATAGLGVYNNIQNAKTNATNAATAQKTAAVTANANGAATVNWSKYLPWALGGAAVLLGVFFFMRRKS